MGIDFKAAGEQVLGIVKDEAKATWDGLSDADKEEVKKASYAVGKYLVLTKTDPAKAEVERPFAESVVASLKSSAVQATAGTVLRSLLKFGQILLPILLAAI